MNIFMQHSLLVAICATLVPTVGYTASESVPACFWASQGVLLKGYTTASSLNAQEVLMGKTVQVRRLIETTAVGAITKRSFTATSLIEEQDALKETSSLTYQGRYWCRHDVFAGKEKCYGVVVATVDPAKGQQVFEVEKLDEALSSSACSVVFHGVIEGIAIPKEEPQQQAPAPNPAPATRRRTG